MSGRDSGSEPSVAVITGGSSGLGLASAHRLGKTHRLVIADVNQARLDEAAAALREKGCDVTTALADITVPDSVARLAEISASRGRFGALVNAAGLSPTMADGRRIMEVNLVGAALVERAFLTLAGPGAVAVLIASSAGHNLPFFERNDKFMREPLSDGFWADVQPDLAHPALSYSVSKRGVMVYCETVCPEWGARGARIVTVSPGMISTPMGDLEFANQPAMKTMLDLTPLQRLGRADEIAAAVEFLVSASASFITGTDLLVDGGVTPRFKALARPGN